MSKIENKFIKAVKLQAFFFLGGGGGWWGGRQGGQNYFYGCNALFYTWKLHFEK